MGVGGNPTHNDKSIVSSFRGHARIGDDQFVKIHVVSLNSALIVVVNCSSQKQPEDKRMALQPNTR